MFVISPVGETLNTQSLSLCDESLTSWNLVRGTTKQLQVIANFMAERLDEHQKLQWKLRSILKASEEEVDD